MLQAEWERLPTESTEAWEAFCAYRDMGGDASCAAVARRLGKSKTLIDRWSSEHGWQARVRAWQAAQDRAATDARLAGIKSAEQARLDAVVQMNDEHAKVARGLIGKVIARLKTLDVTTLSPRDLAHWLDVAVKVERQARGAPAAEIALTGADGGAIEVSVQQQAAERISSVIGAVLAEGAASSVVGKPN